MTVTGATLRALRESRFWDKHDMARALRDAAGEHLSGTLHKQIDGWEKGRHTPAERYLLLYRKVFPELAAAQSPPAGPAEVLDRAARVTGPGSPAAVLAAAAAGRPELAALVARQEELERQIAENTARLRALMEADRARSARLRERSARLREKSVRLREDPGGAG